MANANRRQQQRAISSATQDRRSASQSSSKRSHSGRVGTAITRKARQRAGSIGLQSGGERTLAANRQFDYASDQEVGRPWYNHSCRAEYRPPPPLSPNTVVAHYAGGGCVVVRDHRSEQRNDHCQRDEHTCGLPVVGSSANREDGMPLLRPEMGACRLAAIGVRFAGCECRDLVDCRQSRRQ